MMRASRLLAVSAAVALAFLPPAASASAQVPTPPPVAATRATLPLPAAVEAAMLPAGKVYDLALSSLTSKAHVSDPGTQTDRTRRHVRVYATTLAEGSPASSAMLEASFFSSAHPLSCHLDDSDRQAVSASGECVSFHSRGGRLMTVSVGRSFSPASQVVATVGFDGLPPRDTAARRSQMLSSARTLVAAQLLALRRADLRIPAPA